MVPLSSPAAALPLAAAWHELLELSHARRERRLAFTDFLEHETVFFVAPASTRFHLNVVGGLVQHSANVATLLLQLPETLAPDLDPARCASCGLFHSRMRAEQRRSISR